MKYRFIIGYAMIVLAGCLNNNGTDTKNNASSEAPVADTSIHPLLEIGGCYAYKLNNDSFVTLVVIEIAKEEDEVYYKFVAGGKSFDKAPSAPELRNAGIWARKIPGGDLASAKEGNSILTFSSFTIKEKNLRPALNNFTRIDHIDISNKIKIGSFNSLDSMNGFPQFVRLLLISNQQMDKEQNIYPQYPNEVVSWQNLPVAAGPAEKAVPFTRWILSRKTADPKAVASMQEEWYWSQIDDLSPFGNDDGSDALYGFKQWRDRHPESEPASYVAELENIWGQAFTHLDITDETKLREVELTTTYYRDIDRGILAVALGQVVLEARISGQLKNWGIKACQREMTNYSMKGMSDENKKEYRQRLEKIISLLNSF